MKDRAVAFINPEPHFFQPLLQNFVTNFSLPQSFLKYLPNVQELKKNDKKTAFLKERREKTYWKVELCTSDDDRGVYHFRDGWQEFCINHSLQVGDFLVFQHKGHLVFHVSIFDPSCCQPQFSSSPSMPNFPPAVDHTSNVTPLHGKRGFIKIGSHKVDSLAPVKATFKPRGYPYFQAVVKKYWCRSGVPDLHVVFELTCTTKNHPIFNFYKLS